MVRARRRPLQPCYSEPGRRIRCIAAGCGRDRWRYRQPLHRLGYGSDGYELRRGGPRRFCERAEEVDIETQAPDGPAKRTTIWIVVADGEAFVAIGQRASAAAGIAPRCQPGGRRPRRRSAPARRRPSPRPTPPRSNACRTRASRKYARSGASPRIDARSRTRLPTDAPARARLTVPGVPDVLRRVQAPAARHRPAETDDWLESLDQVVEQEGENRARFLLYKLLKRARQLHIGLPPLTQTRYINTISPEQEPDFPGDEEMELRIRRIIRWNAVAMVLRANTRFTGHRRPPRDVRLVGEPVRGRLQPLLPRQGRRRAGRPDLLPGPRGAGHLRPRLPRGPPDRGPARPLPARDRPGQGALRPIPHPRLMPDFWEFPTVSMGLGPLSAIYQARFNRYLQNRGLNDTSNSRVWAFLGDGETDEPESLGALHVAAREGLDNLTFVVNCNLQRLDGPVRGNGKIIQELEAVFRGAGWNVIKVIWAREWDDAARPRRRRRARRADERDARRRVPEVLGRRRRLHPRALLRARTRACASSSSTSPTTTSPSSAAAATTTARSTRRTRPRPSTRAPRR